MGYSVVRNSDGFFRKRKIDKVEIYFFYSIMYPSLIEEKKKQVYDVDRLPGGIEDMIVYDFLFLKNSHYLE